MPAPEVHPTPPASWDLRLPDELCDDEVERISARVDQLADAAMYG